METHDSLGRRNRFIPTSTGASVTLQPRDLEWFQFIHDHGPQTSRALHARTQPTHRNLHASLERLAQLSSEEGTKHGGRYLFEPNQHNHSYNPFGSFLIYDLTPAGYQVLKDLGTYSDNRPRGRNPLEHAYMSAAITGNIETEARKNGVEYIPQHVILDRAGAELGYEVPYQWNGKTHRKVLKPDGLFALKLAEKTRLYVLEADRGTEGGDLASDKSKSYKRNVLQYQEYIGGGLYKEHLQATSGMVVLFVTLSETARAKWHRVIEKTIGSSNYLWSQVAEEFRPYMKPPLPIERFYTEPWQRVGSDPFYIHQS